MKLEHEFDTNRIDFANVSVPSKEAISRFLAVAIIVVIVIVAAIGAFYFAQMGSKIAQSTSSLTEPSTITSSASSSIVSTSSPLILYSADAYVAETASLATGFTIKTGISTVPPKGGGSLTLAREIAQGNPVSVFVSVSKSAVSSTYLNSTAPGWAIGFAGDQMSIAYSNATRQNPASEKVITAFQTASETNTTGAWSAFYSNLTSGSVKVGISDPNADPAGFRGWLVLEAAGFVYAGGNQSHFTTRILQNKGNITGASAADLVAPLQAGQIQFLFIYRSAAVAQNLNYLQLPFSVNLGNPSFEKYYSQFTYKTEGGLEIAAPIVLFVTVPKDATNPLGSLEFTSYIVQHSSILSSYGLTPFSPAVLYNSTDVPQTIQNLISQGDVVVGGSLS